MSTKKHKNRNLQNEIDELIMKRNSITAKLTRFEEYLDTITQESNITELKLRFDRYERVWEEFDTVQAQIEVVQPDLQEMQHEIRSQFEDKYFRLAAQAEDLINVHRASTPLLTNNPAQESASSTPIMQKQPQVRLPIIDLPKFNGSYEQWTQFYNTFSTLIHSNQNLSFIEKFHYLKASVIGEALNTIESLSLTTENYEVAWKLLIERYENKRLIIHNHVNALLDLPAITRESAFALRQLCDNFLKHIRALEVLKQPIESWDAFIVPLIYSKFDNLTKREWEAEQSSNNNLPTLTEITEFLKKRCRMLEAIHSNVKIENKNQHFTKPQKFTSHVTTTEKHRTSCPYCQDEHRIYNCSKFLKLTIDERWQAVKQMKICSNCLNRSHFSKDCRSASCRTCNKRHNSLLHNTEATITKDNDSSVGKQETKTIATMCSSASKTHVLLSTAVVHVYDSAGKAHNCRALLDSGSQSHYITKKLCQKLKLDLHNVQFSVSGIGEVATQISQCTEVKIKSRFNEFQSILKCLILDSITDNIPNTKLNTSTLQIPANIKLADETYDTPGNIDLLIGADLFFQLLCVGQIQLGNKQPTLQKTKLGWIISGTLSSNERMQPQKTRCHLNINQQLQNQIAQFWNIEEVQNKVHHSTQEEKCEQHFSENTTRDNNGRYVVKLPINEEASALGNSYETALKRFHYLENRLEKKPELKEEYLKFMREYENLQHMTFIGTQHDQNINTYYLPHHAVVKESSTTTKVRVVFDGSSKTSNNISLNDILLIGPTIQDDLCSIIMRFRSYQYVLTADIEKMYRQVNVHEQDRNLQRILWREDTSQPIKIYTLNTVTYGTAPASFLAIRSLNQLASDENDSYPNAAQVLQTSFYVDDCLTGAASIDEAKKLKEELTSLLAKGQFNLRKWKSNESRILEESNDDCTNSLSLSLNEDETCKTLGLYWNPVQDTLQYCITITQGSKVTKRSILSLISQIFDPLGLLGPIIVTAKVIMQQLWQLKIDWDETLPISIHTKWARYYCSLNQLNEFKIPRKIIPNSHSTCIELHGFCDASEAAFGAAIYIKTKDTSGVSFSTLICSKSRVAPLKSISIPRLELCAALLLAQLSKTVQDAMHFNFNQIYHWTDSTIVLAWIDTSPHLLKQFVANRVCQIQELSHNVIWKHVRSEDNPADLLSRGTNPATLEQQTSWWSGPTWLTLDQSHWPVLEQKSNYTNEELEIRKTTIVTTAIQDNSILTKYSSFNKLKRIVAWCFRFKHNASHMDNKIHGLLTIEELRSAEITILKIVQQQSLKEEIKDLQQNQYVDRRSKLANLTPFLDNQGLIRVGGRLKFAHIPFNQRHPIILPSKHAITDAIIRDEHILRYHCGPQALLAFIRLKFWPLAAKGTIRKITRKCTVCFRCNPKPIEHTMGNIPEARIRPGNRPFAVTGVDYCGPFNVIQTRGRGRKAISKCYIAVFVCFSTKAVHMEPVTQLTAEAFLATLRRFTARRGLCSELYSDNATNFTRANCDLQELYELLQKEENAIKLELNKQQIKWHFIPPRSPHFGGLWEAAVKSLKYHLKRIYSFNLTFEELYTVITQIEAILNSRPLIPMSSDPNDLNFLTPAHFLIGDSLVSPLEDNVINTKEGLLSRWQHVQKIRQYFWARWSRDYLHQLQQRTKWVHQHSNVNIGSLVLLVDEGLPPQRWSVGRVTELHPGEDDVVRVVSVKTSAGVFKRAIRKICALPIDVCAD